MDDQNKTPQDEQTPEPVAVETTDADIPAPETYSDEAVESPYNNGFLRRLDNFYGVTKKKSSIRVEILAGVATFLAMCYTRRRPAWGSTPWSARSSRAEPQAARQ